MLECRYKGQCRIEYDTDFDVCYPCIGDGSETCLDFEPMPDVKSLLALADEFSEAAMDAPSFFEEADDEVRQHLCGAAKSLISDAHRIREALGVES